MERKARCFQCSQVIVAKDADALVLAKMKHKCPKVKPPKHKRKRMTPSH